MYRFVLMFFLVAVMASPSFAVVNSNLKYADDASFSDTGPVITDSSFEDMDFTLSSNVGFDYNSADPFDNYTVITANSQGTKAYGVQNDFQGVLVTVGDATDDLTAPNAGAWSDTLYMLVGGEPDDSLPSVLTDGIAAQ